MSTPSNYSQELPARCLQLVEALWPCVQNVRVPGEEHLGPLTTTFLLAMSAPIIVLPIERVERYRDRADAGYMNERPLDPSLASEIDAVLVKGLLGNAPFFQEGNWRFASIPNDSYNVALHYPNEIYEALSAPAAFDTARRMQAQEWASCLRNAVAHGGVLYLNRDGRPSHDQQAEVLAFVSAKYREDDLHHRAPPARLKVLQITEVGFASFLKGWVAWLRSCGLDRQLAA